MNRIGQTFAMLLVVVAASCVIPAIAQEPRQPVPRLFPFQESGKHGKWGYMDAQANVVIVPKYQRADHFHEGRAMVWMDRGDTSAAACINETGRLVFETLRPPWDCPSLFGGPPLVPQRAFRAIWLFRPRREVVIRPKYDEVEDFTEDLARVNLGAKPIRAGGLIGGKWGYVDTQGREAIPLQFDKADDFHEDVPKCRSASGPSSSTKPGKRCRLL